MKKATNKITKKDHLKEIVLSLKNISDSLNSLVKFNDTGKVLDEMSQLPKSNNLTLQESAENAGRQIKEIEVTVDYSVPHNEAAMKGGPDTDSSYDVLKCGDKYHTESGKVKRTLVLLNFKKGEGSYEKALEWGKENGLTPTIPHDVFAIGEQYPNFHRDQGTSWSYVVETTGCTFDDLARACYVYWNDSVRRSNLAWQVHFGGADDWFAFRK